MNTYFRQSGILLILAAFFVGAPPSVSPQVQRVALNNVTPLSGSGALSTCVTTPPEGGRSHWIAMTWAAMQECHTLASDGDTISLLPRAHTAALNERLIVSKWLTLDGTGATVLDNVCAGGCEQNGDQLITINDATVGAPNGQGTIFRNFKISQGTATHQTFGVIVMVQTANGKITRLTGNEYVVRSYDNGYITLRTPRGLIDHNKEHGLINTSSCSIGANKFAVIKWGTLQNWRVPAKWGGEDTNGDYNVYLEDNDLSKTGSDVDDNGRWVWRFNTMDLVTFASHGADSSYTGLRSAEIYKNAITYTREPQPSCGGQGNLYLDIQAWLESRGASTRWIDNVFPNHDRPMTQSRPGIKFQSQSLTRQGGSWPCWRNPTTLEEYPYPLGHQIGWGFTVGAFSLPQQFVPGAPVLAVQDPEPAIIAGNTGPVSGYVNPAFEAGTTSPCNPRTMHDVNDFMQRNREVFAQAANTEQTSRTSPFDGTGNGPQGATLGGTGFGPREMRPATCTHIKHPLLTGTLQPGQDNAGVYYWSTNVGSWNLSGKNGPNGYPQGVLDRCDATNHWQDNFYVPYRYPHPLNVPVNVAQTMGFANQPRYGVLNQPLVVEVATTSQTANANYSIQPMGSGCTFSGIGLAQAVNGTVTWNLTPTVLAGPCTFQVTSPGLPTITTAPFTVSLNKPPEMHFEPGLPANTNIGSVFAPTITVRLDLDQNNMPLANNLLQASILSGDCMLGGTSLVSTNASGIATFPAMTAQALGQGCRMRITNMTTIAMPVLESGFFNVITPPGGAITVVNNGDAQGCIRATASANTRLDNQTNQTPFDTTGADTIIAAVSWGGSTADPMPILRDRINDQPQGGVSTLNTYQVAVTIPVTSQQRLTIFYTHPGPNVGTPHSWLIAGGTNSNPGICVIAVKGTAPGPPIVVAGNADMVGSTPPNPPIGPTTDARQARFTMPIAINRDGLIVATAIWQQSAILSNTPSGYSRVGGSMDSNTDGGVQATSNTLGLHLAWKYDTLLLAEDPRWSVTNVGIATTAAAVFRPADIVVQPALSFMPDPPVSNVISGSLIPPFQVHSSSNTTAGTVTLTPQNCPGVTFMPSPITATMATGLASFNNVRPTGEADGCTFQASMPNAQSAVSQPFNIISPPPVSGGVEIVNAGHAYGCAATSGTGTSVRLELQDNGLPFDTTGADMLALFLSNRSATNISISDQVGTNAATMGWNQEGGGLNNGNNQRMSVHWKNPGANVGPNHAFTVATTTGIPTSPTICVVALKGTKGMGPMWTGQAEQTIPMTSINLTAPLPINGNAFIISGLVPLLGTRNPPYPEHFISVIGVGTFPDGHGIGVSWKEGAFGLENPGWSTPGSPQAMMTRAVAWPSNAAPPPPGGILVITQQPTNTVAGETFSPTVTGIKVLPTTPAAQRGQPQPAPQRGQRR